MGGFQPLVGILLSSNHPYCKDCDMYVLSVVIVFDQFIIIVTYFGRLHKCSRYIW